MSASPEQNSLWHDVSDLTRLAGPVIVARASIMLMGLVDTVMVGRYATHELGYMAMGNILWGTLLVTCGGLLIGTLVFTANAYGAGNDKECGQVWRRSLPYAVLLGLVGTLLCALAEPALLQFGQTRELAHEGGKVALILGVGLPFTTAYMACASFLEGIKRPVAGIVVMIAANVVNIVANWMLIFGNFGAPELGAEGSAWATTIMRAISLSLIAGYIWTMRDHGRFGRTPSFGSKDRCVRDLNGGRGGIPILCLCAR